MGPHRPVCSSQPGFRETLELAWVSEILDRFSTAPEAQNVPSLGSSPEPLRGDPRVSLRIRPGSAGPKPTVLQQTSHDT